MASERRESSSMAKKKFKRSIKRKREQEVERLDTLPWNSSIPTGEDDDGETFSTLFAGSDELDGGFLSLEEIDGADYNLDVPMPESEETEIKFKKQDRDGEEETVGEIIEEEDDESIDEDLETVNVKEKKTKKKKKKKKQKKTFNDTR